MKRHVELYLIGTRIKRLTVLLIALFSVICGIVLNIFFKSIIIGITFGTIFWILAVIVTRKYYWVISNNGIYTPLNFGIIKYIFIIIKYTLIGVDTDDIVFINYKTIAYLNLINKAKELSIQIVRKEGEFISIVISKETINQDLLNSINYIKRKGIKIKNIQCLDNIKIKNEGELIIKKIYKFWWWICSICFSNDFVKRAKKEIKILIGQILEFHRIRKVLKINNKKNLWFIKHSILSINKILGGKVYVKSTFRFSKNNK